MRVLLDTHVLIWALEEPERLSEAARELIEDKGTEVLFSAASIWEIAIKCRLGRAGFAARPERVTQAALLTGFSELPITAAIAARVADLPLHHRDPFDRLIVAHAMSQPARLYTADPRLPPYSELIHFIP